MQLKSDASPLTRADRDANAVICQALQNLTPHIPIVSEEEKMAPYSIRQVGTPSLLALAARQPAAASTRFCRAPAVCRHRNVHSRASQTLCARRRNSPPAHFHML